MEFVINCDKISRIFDNKGLMCKINKLMILEDNMAKNLIIYYSRKGENYFDGSIRKIEKGNTEIVAEFIKKAAGADLFEVETENEYSASYNICVEEAKKELEDDERPKLKKYLPDIDGYSNIVIAGPCWWGTYPCAIFSQLDKLSFMGKRFSLL